jgi:hypothetical protein
MGKHNIKSKINQEIIITITIIIVATIQRSGINQSVQ